MLLTSKVPYIELQMVVTDKALRTIEKDHPDIFDALGMVVTDVKLWGSCPREGSEYKLLVNAPKSYGVPSGTYVTLQAVRNFDRKSNPVFYHVRNAEDDHRIIEVCDTCGQPAQPIREGFYQAEWVRQVIEAQSTLETIWIKNVDK